MTYSDVINYIQAIPMNTKRDLSNVIELLAKMGNPEKKLKIIHVGGTNGKGSTSSFITQMLMAMGYDVGLFTSPYLETFNERIRINASNILDQDLVEAFVTVKKAIDSLSEDGELVFTQFDLITAMAYHYFASKKTDFVVLEVGLGGEFDSTNTCSPAMSVICSISLDHMEFLGNSIESITKAKAGIIKRKTPVVLYQQSQVVEEIIAKKAQEMEAPLVITDFDSIHIKSRSIYGQEFDIKIFDRKFESLFISITGEHQVKNFVTALTTLLLMERKGLIKAAEDSAIREGAKKARWNGRTELFWDDPVTILDGAHNADGAKMLSQYIEEYLSDYYLIMVFGVLSDKQIDLVAQHLIPWADKLVLTKPLVQRAEDVYELYGLIKEYVKDQVEVDITQAVSEAVKIAQEAGESLKGSQKVAVLYAGSLYLIGEARTGLRKYYKK